MNNLMILFLLMFASQTNATGAQPPINQYIDNAVKANSTLNGAGGSVSQAASGVAIEGIKTGNALEVQGAATNQASNQSSGGGSGSASANSTLQAVKTGNLGVGYGAAGIQLRSSAAAGNNEASRVDTGARATVTANVQNGAVSEVKNAVTQANGAGNVTANVSASATFNTVKLVGVSLPPLAIPNCPKVW